MFKNVYKSPGPEKSSFLKSFSLSLLIVCFCVFQSYGNVPYQTENLYLPFLSQDEPLDTEVFIDLLLTASGSEPDRFGRYHSRIENLISGLETFMEAEKRKDESQPEGDLVLRFMHETSLKRYYEYQTRLDRLLDTGTYNCVSSAVLYMLLARAAGLDVHGIHAVDHAFCQVLDNNSNQMIDVETTNLWGYDPGTKRAFSSEFTDITGFVYVPPGDYAKRDVQSDRDMAGLILQNRIVEHQKRNEFVKALNLAADRLVLTGSETALKDYFDSVQNLAAWHNLKKEYEVGVVVINTVEYAGYELPDFLVETRYQLIYNMCSSVLNDGETGEAERLLQTYGVYIPDNLTEELTFLIEERKVDDLIRKGYKNETVNRILELEDQGVLTKKRAEEMLIYLYAKEAEKIALENSFLDSLVFLRTARNQLFDNREFQRLLAVYENNYAVSIHNSVIPLLEESLWDQAENIILNALTVVPGNRILKDDLKKLDSFR